jgi:hypothetical protein
MDVKQNLAFLEQLSQQIDAEAGKSRVVTLNTIARRYPVFAYYYNQCHLNANESPEHWYQTRGQAMMPAIEAMRLEYEQADHVDTVASEVDSLSEEFKALAQKFDTLAEMLKPVLETLDREDEDEEPEPAPPKRKRRSRKAKDEEQEDPAEETTSEEDSDDTDEE